MDSKEEVKGGEFQRHMAPQLVVQNSMHFLRFCGKRVSSQSSGFLN